MVQVAVLQMVTSTKIAQNLDLLSSWFAKAKDKNAQLILLPEYFACMSQLDTDKLQYAETEGDGPIQNHIRALAKQFKIWVIAGAIALKHSKTRVTSSCLVYDEYGMQVARYDKIHLFDVCLSLQETYQESLTIAKGNKLVVVDTPIGRVGLSICYDLRFPELYRQLAIRGADIFVVPSAFTALTGQAHWHVLLRARAIENLCYVIAANQGGNHENGRKTYGHSMIIDPWGSILSEATQGTELITAHIDLALQKEKRQQFPCHQHHVL